MRSLSDLPRKALETELSTHHLSLRPAHRTETQEAQEMPNRRPKPSPKHDCTTTKTHRAQTNSGPMEPSCTWKSEGPVGLLRHIRAWISPQSISSQRYFLWILQIIQTTPQVKNHCPRDLNLKGKSMYNLVTAPSLQVGISVNLFVIYHACIPMCWRGYRRNVFTGMHNLIRSPWRLSINYSIHKAQL